MAFGLKRSELVAWKKNVENGNIDFLTHYWLDDRFPGCHTVTKVGCADINKLIAWGKNYDLREEWIHKYDKYPHYDLVGERQKEILIKEYRWDHIERFKL